MNKILHSFTKFGYAKVSNAINKNLIQRINKEIIYLLGKKKINYSSLNKQSKLFNDIIKKKIKNKKEISKELFKIQSSIFNHLENKGFISELLNSKKLKSIFANFFSLDLEYMLSSEFIINISSLESKNYLFKKHHQEIWSGASTDTILIWIPLFQKNTNGQISLIPFSHLWGHVPHQNKEPIKLPNKYKEINSNCKIGDCIIFHTMTLHRSNALKEKDNTVGRLSLAVRNFKYKKNGIDNLSNWKIYSYSPFSIVEKQLGNKQLSPYRISPKKIHKSDILNYFKNKK